MNRFSRYAAAAIVASLVASSAAYASVPSSGSAPSPGGWQEASVLADASVPDMDIRLLCHEHSRQGWPCGDQNVLALCDFAHRTCGLDSGVETP